MKITKLQPPISRMFLFMLALVLWNCSSSADLILLATEDAPLKLKSGVINLTDDPPEYTFNPQYSDLIAGQFYNAGIVKIETNQDGDFIVSVTTDNGWMLKDIQIYGGLITDLPVNKNGLPLIGKFPVNVRFSRYQNTFSDKIIFHGDTPPVVIVVHANVVQLNESGKVIRTDAAWIAGQRFVENGSWASYFIYEIMPG